MSDTKVALRVVSGLGEGPRHLRTDSALPLDERTYDRALACVHCGLCLPTCPTYVDNGLEADSPRGRINLIRGLAEGRIEPTESVRHHLDLCLDCRACETACPSGVVYHELIEEARQFYPPRLPEGPDGRLLRLFLHRLLPHPLAMRLALLPARLLQKLGLWRWLTHPALLGRLPVANRALGRLARALPEDDGPVWSRRLRPGLHRRTTPRWKPAVARIGFFTGCVDSVLFAHVQHQAVDLLRAAGCDVWVVAGQGCCGAIAHHGGHADEARRLARANIEAFSRTGDHPPDYIVTTAAGCGAMLREYDHLFRDEADADRARDFSRRIGDITQVLAMLELPAPRRAPRRSFDQTVVYHDACHLQHAQRITDAPRKLLAQLPGVHVVPLGESELCCGAAGSYSLTQPDMAARLARRKLHHITATGARICITANPGCAMQIASTAAAEGVPLEVIHPVTLMHRAVFAGAGAGDPYASR